MGQGDRRGDEARRRRTGKAPGGRAVTIHHQVFTHLNAVLERRAKRARYINDPVAWAKDMLDGELWSKQQEVTCSVRDTRKTAVAAAHGVGKSYLASVLACWWIDVHPIDEVFLATTAPFQSQISAILWKQ